MKNIKSISSIIIGALLSFPAHATSNEKLIFAIDFVRHGDRTPSCEIPISPHHWKEGLGELTDKGKRQEISLGKQLRKIYVYQHHLLPEMYTTGTVYARSTGVPRTIASTESILLGLYPTQSRPSTDAEIPIHTVKVNDDGLLIANPGYNVFSLLSRYMTNYQTWKKINATHQFELKDWSNKTGLPLTYPQELDCLADNLHARIEHKIPLPNGISNAVANQIIALSDTAILNEFNHHSFPMGKAFLKTINDYMSDAIKSKNGLKYALFVGHDSSMMSVMHALKISIKQTPEYASRLNFSLYEKDHSYYVKVTYDNKPVNVTSCKRNICTLDQFVAFT